MSMVVGTVVVVCNSVVITDVFSSVVVFNVVVSSLRVVKTVVASSVVVVGIFVVPSERLKMTCVSIIFKSVSCLYEDQSATFLHSDLR